MNPFCLAIFISLGSEFCADPRVPTSLPQPCLGQLNFIVALPFFLGQLNFILGLPFFLDQLNSEEEKILGHLNSENIVLQFYS